MEDFRGENEYERSYPHSFSTNITVTLDDDTGTNTLFMTHGCKQHFSKHVVTNWHVWYIFVTMPGVMLQAFCSTSGPLSVWARLLGGKGAESGIIDICRMQTTIYQNIIVKMW